MRLNKCILYLAICFLVLLSSCATASFSKYTGVGRVKHYDIFSDNLPDGFDGFKIAFVSDLHYKSKLTRKRLPNVVRAINSVSPDVVLMGGDYVGSGNAADMDTLFSFLACSKSQYGIYGIMGNHDAGIMYAPIKAAMKKYGVTCMEDKGYVLNKNGASIVIAGVGNSFKNNHGKIPFLQEYSKNQFLILVTHTPDYAEENDVSNADLVLSGHTHGGQVSFFKCIAPVSNSKYGTRFLTGLKHNSAGVPMIITNGLGTSRRKLRLFTPSEVVFITLHKK